MGSEPLKAATRVASVKRRDDERLTTFKKRIERRIESVEFRVNNNSTAETRVIAASNTLKASPRQTGKGYARNLRTTSAM